MDKSYLVTCAFKAISFNGIWVLDAEFFWSACSQHIQPRLVIDLKHVASNTTPLLLGIMEMYGREIACLGMRYVV